MTSVLIVDGNAAMRRLLHAVVGTMANDIYECSDGQEATVIYRERRPDYVLLDVEMKGLDGIQVTKQILQLDPRARIIIVTQQNNPVWRSAAASAGAFGYVLKDDLKALRRLFQESDHLSNSP